MTPIYHIVHRDRLASIFGAGFLYSDAEVRRRGAAGTVIGMPHIKRRRMVKPVECHAGLTVGECVPFYFCPRSVMLYILHRGNHPDLAYAGGDRPILHLEFEAGSVARWAVGEGLRVAYTDRNAGSAVAEFRIGLDGLRGLDWEAIRADDWQGCVEEKQAEFLVEGRVPVSLLRRIGAKDAAMRREAMSAAESAGLGGVPVEERAEWYY